ncbi:MAG: glycosyltransferase family 25 protein [Thiopseudomonas sp.]|nr:glycosyltransferase family 25 protein [Thiopseudomonas sp.]MCK9465578.1 glycosyltransferase family 25 protein [Thiopseudomonas sp.]
MGPLSNLKVDAVLCISTSERADRREHLKKQFQDSGLKIEYVLVERDHEDGQRGCFLSHQLCAKIALERNYKNILILEDDVTLEHTSLKKIRIINKFLLNKNPDILYLGATLGKIWLTWSFSIARIRSQGAFAYILSNKSCETIVELKYEGRGIDNYYSKIFKGYSVFPFMIGHQVEEVLPSNIRSTRGDYFYSSADRARNNIKQYVSVLKNIPKTIFRVDF